MIAWTRCGDLILDDEGRVYHLRRGGDGEDDETVPLGPIAADPDAPAGLGPELEALRAEWHAADAVADVRAEVMAGYYRGLGRP